MAWAGFKKALAADPDGVAAVLAVQIAAAPERPAFPSVRDELAHIVEKESAWNPAATNPGSKATGLIQFMPSTAKGLGTTVDDLRAMSRTQQAPYVQKFFDQVTSSGKRKLRRIGDLYILTFMPGHLGDADADVIFAPGTAGWDQNPGLRESPAGPITAGSVRRAGTPAEPLPAVVPVLPTPVTPSTSSTSSSWSPWLFLFLLYAMRDR